MRTARILLAVAFGALAAYGWGPVFGQPYPVALVVAVAVAGSAALLGAWAPRAGWLAATGAVVVVLAAALATDTRGDLLSGPWRLLSGAVPAEPAGPGLAAVAVLVGWSTLAAGLLAAYGSRVLLALAPPVLSLGLGLSLGASAGRLPVWFTPAAIALVAALAWTGRRVPNTTTPPRYGTVLTAVLVSGLAVVAVLGLGSQAPGVDDREPADLRALVSAPVQPRSGVSPLQQFLALRDGERPLKVTGTSSRSGAILRMATLSTFDGTYWTVEGDFRRAGTALPPGPTSGVPVTLHVDVATGELDWLLSAGRPTHVSVAGLGVDEATGDVAVPVDGSPPVRYDATSRLPVLGVDEVLAGDPAPLGEPLAPPLPPVLASFAASAVAGSPEGPDQLQALYHRFVDASDFRYDQAQEVAGGHGYYQLQKLLETKRGTAEQYASAYAVLARHLGFDAQVVMGFRPEYDGDSFTVTGRDVDAWVEVRFARLGWVTVDPSPRGNPIGTRAGAPPAGGRQTRPDDPLGKTSEADKPRPEALPAPDGAGPGGLAGAVGRSATLAGVILVALLALLILSPTLKSIRRVRRKRAPSERRAVLGAWWETLDRLREAGIAAGPSHTTGQVADLAPAVPSVARLANLVDLAAYAPEDPPRGLRLEAWRAAGDAGRRLRTGRPVHRRLAAWLDPRPLLR